MMKWGTDPQVGDVIIMGECSLTTYLTWQRSIGRNSEDAKFDCFKKYSVSPKETTKFLLCMREEDGRRFVHVAPAVAITIGATSEEDDD